MQGHQGPLAGCLFWYHAHSWGSSLFPAVSYSRVKVPGHWGFQSFCPHASLEGGIAVIGKLCGLAPVCFTLSPLGFYLQLKAFIEPTPRSRSHGPSSGHLNTDMAPDLRRGVPEFTEQTLSWVILRFCPLVWWGPKTEIKFRCRKRKFSSLHLRVYDIKFSPVIAKQNQNNPRKHGAVGWIWGVCPWHLCPNLLELKVTAARCPGFKFWLHPFYKTSPLWNSVFLLCEMGQC